MVCRTTTYFRRLLQSDEKARRTIPILNILTLILLLPITPDNKVVGVCVSYDGSLLRMLRKAFIEGAKAAFGRDFSDMPDETKAGELYIDSLSVGKEHRGKGIAKLLLRATIEKGKRMNLPTGLLVDTNNPKAEALYNAVGFVYKDDNQWGGHAMRHMVYTL